MRTNGFRSLSLLSILLLEDLDGLLALGSLLVLHAERLSEKRKQVSRGRAFKRGTERTLSMATFLGGMLGESKGCRCGRECEKSVEGLDAGRRGNVDEGGGEERTERRSTTSQRIVLRGQAHHVGGD